MTLDARELREFDERGYVVRRGVFPRAGCQALCDRLSALIERVARDYRTGARTERDFWRLLARSAFGLEVFADAPPGDGPWEPHAMRIGHALHLVDGAFRKACCDPAVTAIVRQVTPPPAKVIQSAVIYKQPSSDNVQFGPHQDASYLTTEPESLVLAFVALDDTDRANGCLEVVPASHREGLKRVLRMTANGFEPVAASGNDDPRPRDILEMGRGDVALVHGRAQHASGPNHSSRPRRGLITHFMSGTSRLAPTAWIQRPPGGFPDA